MAPQAGARAAPGRRPPSPLLYVGERQGCRNPTKPVLGDAQRLDTGQGGGVRDAGARRTPPNEPAIQPSNNPTEYWFKKLLDFPSLLHHHDYMTSTATTRTHCPDQIYIAADDEAQAEYAAYLQALTTKREAHREAYNAAVLSSFDSGYRSTIDHASTTTDIAERANDYAASAWPCYLPEGTSRQGVIDLIDDNEMFQVPCNCGTGCGSLRWVTDSNLRHEDRHNETEAR